MKILILTFSKKRMFYLFILTLLIASCEQFKDIEYDIPFEGEELVVYGFLSSTDSSTIQLYQTQPVLEDSPAFELKDTVIVHLLENGNRIKTFTHYQNIHHRFFYPYQSNSDYSLEMVWQGDLISSMPVGIPIPTPIDSVNYSLSEDSSKIDIKIIFEDSAENKYYDYAIEKYANGERVLDNSEPVLESFIGVFSDESFENTTKEIFTQQKIELLISDENFNVQLVTVDSFAIHLYTLSEAFFQFYSSKEINNEGNLGSVFDSNQLLWTNINEGFGFVGGFTKKSKFIKL